MATATPYPPPEQIQECIKLCRIELAELKRLLRAVRAAEKAEAARRARRPVTRKGGRCNE